MHSSTSGVTDELGIFSDGNIETASQVELKPAPVAHAVVMDAVVVDGTFNALRPSGDVEQGGALVLASANEAPIQTARPIPMIRQISERGLNMPTGDAATKPKPVTQLYSMLIPILFIVFALKYGSSWGKGSSKAEDAKCARGFPKWMLYMGILGIVNGAVVYYVQNANYKLQQSGASPEEMVSKASRLMMISLQSSCLYLAWWVYGQVLLFESEEDCGKKIWELAFVLFWICIASMGCICGLGCCALCAASLAK